jgi:hypothetical protein
MTRFSLLITILVLSCFTGCVAIGPMTVARDRLDYTSAVSESWKRQTLLNLVKLRYADAPVFLDVESIISQYGVQTQLEFELGWFSLPSGDSQTVTGTGTYAERPTVTYAPLLGAKFTRSLMTPIPPAALFSLIQANWPASFLFRLCVQAVNGIYNRSAAAIRARVGDPDFYAVVEALQRIQQAGGMGLRVEGTKGESLVVFQRRVDEATEADRQLIRQKLGLNPDAKEFHLAFGAVAANDREIAVLTRSMLEIMVELAAGIDVPEAHVAEKRVLLPPPAATEEEARLTSLLQVSSSGARPADAYVAVPYRGYWFWIDDRDFPSKRMFSLIMVLFTLVETEQKEETPLLTVPVG